MTLPVVLSLFLAIGGGEDSFATQSALGRDAYRLAGYAAAQSHFEAALDASPAPDRQRAIALGNLSSVLTARSRPQQALAASLEAVAIWQTLPSSDDQAAIGMHNLASIYRALGNYPEAERWQRQALARGAELWGAADARLAPAQIGLATLALALGRPGEAESLYQQAASLPGVAAEHSAVALGGLGNLRIAQHRLREAEPLLREALALRQSAFGAHHPFVASAWNDLGHYHLVRQQPGEAVPCFETALRLYRATDPDGTHAASASNNLAQAYLLQGKRGAAERLLRQAVDAWQARLGAHHPSVAAGLVNLAETHIAQKRYAEAEAGLRRALAIDRQHQTPAAIARDLARLAALAERRQHPAEAASLYAQALQQHGEAGTPPGPDQAGWLEAHARLLRAQEDFAQAARADAQAMTIRVRHALRESRATLP